VYLTPWTQRVSVGSAPWSGQWLRRVQSGPRYCDSIATERSTTEWCIFSSLQSEPWLTDPVSQSVTGWFCRSGRRHRSPPRVNYVKTCATVYGNARTLFLESNSVAACYWGGCTLATQVLSQCGYFGETLKARRCGEMTWRWRWYEHLAPLQKLIQHRTASRLANVIAYVSYDFFALWYFPSASIQAMVKINVKIRSHRPIGRRWFFGRHPKLQMHGHGNYASHRVPVSAADQQYTCRSGQVTFLPPLV